jgi:hypothetical protein
MITLEYQVLSALSLVSEKQSARSACHTLLLNELAQEGWERVTIVKEQEIYYFYLKRLVPS